jgi:hypothetical protein
MRAMPEMPGLPDWLVRDTDESLAARFGFDQIHHATGEDLGHISWFGRGIELIVTLLEEEVPEPLFAVSWGCRGESAEDTVGTHFWDDALDIITRRAEA